MTSHHRRQRLHPPRGVVVILHDGTRVPVEVQFLEHIGGLDVWQTTAVFAQQPAEITVEELPPHTAIRVAIARFM